MEFDYYIFLDFLWKLEGATIMPDFEMLLSVLRFDHGLFVFHCCEPQLFKYIQLVDKDPVRAISLFWAAINAGDRIESALKDMALVMKQLNRSDEAIEAIRSFRHRCPSDSQESIDNILVELYKVNQKSILFSQLIFSHQLNSIFV